MSSREAFQEAFVDHPRDQRALLSEMVIGPNANSARMVHGTSPLLASDLRIFTADTRFVIVLDAIADIEGFFEDEATTALRSLLQAGSLVVVSWSSAHFAMPPWPSFRQVLYGAFSEVRFTHYLLAVAETNRDRHLGMGRAATYRPLGGFGAYELPSPDTVEALEGKPHAGWESRAIPAESDQFGDDAALAGDPDPPSHADMERAVIRALERQDADYWTTQAVSRITGVPVERARNILNSSPQVRRSVVRSPSGRPLYRLATRGKTLRERVAEVLIFSRRAT